MAYHDKHTALMCVGSSPGTEKAKGEFYPTSPEAVYKLLEVEQFESPILEPCCGNGAISNVLMDAGYDVASWDLHDWGFGEPGRDFLTFPVADVSTVLTNPPFSLSMEFTYRALECTKKKQGKVAIFNRLQWLESKKRGPMFDKTPFKGIYVFRSRLPMMSRFDFEGTETTSTICYAWFIWDWTYTGKPTIGWI